MGFKNSNYLKYLRHVVAFSVWVLLLVSLVALVLGSYFPFELLTHFRHIYLMAGFCGLLFLALSGQRRHALAALVVVLANISSLLIYQAPGDGGTLPSSPLKLLVANLLYSNGNHQALIDLVHQENPDLVLLVEVSPAWAEALKVLDSAYPYKLIEPRSTPFGLAALSRRAPARQEILHFSSDGYPLAFMEHGEGNQRISIILDHPMAPVGRKQFAIRNRHFEELANLAAGIPGPLVVVGDLNTTMWSPYFVELLDRAHLANGRQGFGILGTWPSPVPFFRIPIDHVLVRGVKIQTLNVGKGLGSDHRPLIIELSAKPES